MRIKTNELDDALLDWAVAKCKGFDVGIDPVTKACVDHEGVWEPSFNWAQGGPIIEHMKGYCQEKNDETGECYCSTPSVAEDWHDHPVSATGPTPLIAAMRAYVASKLGDEVDVPETLLPTHAEKRQGNHP